MEKIIRSYDKECMKMAMLKQEETFKEQVYELHRLYRIQKLLMQTTATGFVPDGASPLNLSGQFDRTDLTRQKQADLKSSAGDPNTGSEGVDVSDTIDESQIELTLGPSSYNSSASRSKKGDRQLSSSSFSSSSTGSSGDNIISSKRGRFGAGSLVKEEQLLKNERINHPPWIYQVLSLNST